MGLVERPQCDVCGTFNKVTKWLHLFIQETEQLTFDMEINADMSSLFEASEEKFLCPKCLKRYSRFVDRAKALVPRKAEEKPHE